MRGWPDIPGRVFEPARTVEETYAALQPAVDESGAPLRYYSTIDAHPHMAEPGKEVVAITGWVRARARVCLVMFCMHALLFVYNGWC